MIVRQGQDLVEVTGTRSCILIWPSGLVIGGKDAGDVLYTLWLAYKRPTRLEQFPEFLARAVQLEGFETCRSASDFFQQLALYDHVRILAWPGS